MHRIRRVKCDEEKPFCARCLKFGADCEGYEVGSRLNASTKLSPRKIIPQKRHQQESLLSSLGRLPFIVVFQDNREYSYFLYFQQEAALGISSHFDQSLFTHVIIQSSWNEPSLRQLAASLGALHKAENPKTLNMPKQETDPHRQYAFQQYGQALKSVQARISANKYRDTTRVALIASLLIYCFENLYGDLDSALRHLEGALQLMQKQLAHTSRRYKHSNNSSPTSKLEDDLVAAFFRLDSGLLSRDNICNAKSSGSRLGMHYLKDTCEIPENSILYPKQEITSRISNYLLYQVLPTIWHRLTSHPCPETSMKRQETYIQLCLLSCAIGGWHLRHYTLKLSHRKARKMPLLQLLFEFGHSRQNSPPNESVLETRVHFAFRILNLGK